LNNSDLDKDLIMIIIQKNIAVGKNNVFPSGALGGSQTKIVDVNQIGRPINKKGRLFPNFPGFLLSTITPKIIENNASRNN